MLRSNWTKAPVSLLQYRTPHLLHGVAQNCFTKVYILRNQEVRFFTRIVVLFEPMLRTISIVRILQGRRSQIYDFDGED